LHSDPLSRRVETVAGFEGHLRTGTRVEAVKKWKEATSYAERYMVKPEEFPEGLQDRQDLGDLERGTPPRPMGDSPGQSQGRLQDQADLQEAGEEEG
jgi:hypothetical protein